MNKLSVHPALKKDAVHYKEYLGLVKYRAPQAFQAVEEVKAKIEERLQLYEHVLQNKQRKEDLKRKRAYREQVELERQAKAKRPSRETSPEFDDAQFDQNLRQYHGNVTPALDGQAHEKVFPELPQLRHEYFPKKEETTSPAPLLPPRSTLEDMPPSHPAIPPKVELEESPTLAALSQDNAGPTVQHKSLESTEAGKPLKTIFLPSSLQSAFLQIAQPNTSQRLETCGILCGKLSLNAFFITTLLIPHQESTENTCQTKDEESIFSYIDSNDLFVLGWIHTHPTQSCFLSSVDLHTQNSYQIMLPEAVAIVLAPSKQQDGVFRLTDPPGIGIITKCQRSGFHPHDEKGLYKVCERSAGAGHVVRKDGLPFECVDLRKL